MDGRVKRIKEWIRGSSLGSRVFTIVSYGVAGALVLLVVYEILAGTILGVDPAPQIPPDGYVADETRIVLSWRKGNHKGEFNVQVAMNGDFHNPVLDKTTKETRLTLPKLKRGEKYCWRVLATDKARISCFTTTGDMVPY